MSCSLAPASDGTSCSSGYCCSGLCVPKNSDGHCGACGVSCATGQTCTNAVSNNGGRHNLPDAWVCTCLGFADCTAYGAGAACFDGHCQCTCPSGSGARTCTGQCSAGTCFMDTIEPMSDNYCGY